MIGQVVLLSPNKQKGLYHMYHKERNLEIYRLHQEGMTFRDIAEKFNISVERVRQIYQSICKKGITDMNSELYRLIVNENSSYNHNHLVGLYNTLRRIGIDSIEALQQRIDDINEHPQIYIHIGDKGRAYLNECLASLKKNA